MGISEEQHDGESGGGLGFFTFFSPPTNFFLRK